MIIHVLQTVSLLETPALVLVLKSKRRRHTGRRFEAKYCFEEKEDSKPLEKAYLKARFSKKRGDIRQIGYGKKTSAFPHYT